MISPDRWSSGMMASLLARPVPGCLSCLDERLAVSTTHSIIGAVIGFWRVGRVPWTAVNWGGCRAYRRPVGSSRRRYRLCRLPGVHGAVHKLILDTEDRSRMPSAMCLFYMFAVGVLSLTLMTVTKGPLPMWVWI